MLNLHYYVDVGMSRLCTRREKFLREVSQRERETCMTCSRYSALTRMMNRLFCKQQELPSDKDTYREDTNYVLVECTRNGRLRFQLGIHSSKFSLA